MKVLMLEAGSIILWKKYTFFTKLWSKVKREELPYNRYTLVCNRTEMLTLGKAKDMLVYEPVRKYNKQEITKLDILISNDMETMDSWEEVTLYANFIRPRTFIDNGGVMESKYYRKVECNEKLDEYIY